MNKKERAVLEAAYDLVALWDEHRYELITDEENNLKRKVRILREAFPVSGGK